MSETNKKATSKAKKKSYTLTLRTFVNGKWLEKGDKIELTKDAADYFKLKNRI